MGKKKKNNKDEVRPVNYYIPWTELYVGYTDSKNIVMQLTYSDGNGSCDYSFVMDKKTSRDVIKALKKLVGKKKK